MRFSAANLVITAETRKRDCRRRFGVSALCGRLPTNALAFPHCAEGSRRTFWRFRTVRTAPDERFGASAPCGRLPDGALAFPHSAGGSPTALWRFRTVRAAPRRRFGVSAQCGRLPDGALALPHRADRSPTALWRFRTVRTAPDGILGRPRRADRFPTNGLGDGAGLFSQISMFSVKEFLSEGSRFCIRAYFFMQILKKASSRRRKSCR